MKAQGKRFLSERGDEGGSVRWYVNTEEDYCYTTDAYLYISDCTKRIDLEFYSDDNKGLSKRVTKLDNLIEELQNFREALLQAEKNLRNFITRRNR